MNRKAAASIIAFVLAAATVLGGCGKSNPAGAGQEGPAAAESAEPAGEEEQSDGPSAPGQPGSAEQPGDEQPDPTKPGSSGQTTEEAPPEDTVTDPTAQGPGAGTTTGDVEVAEEPGMSDGPGGTEEQGSGREPGSDNGILVVYFSRTGEQYGVGTIKKGNTAILAEMIADDTGADLYEITPENDNYPSTYDKLTEVAKKEQNENARPAYTDDVPDLTYYSTIFIGSPIWWEDWPMIMYTFFENEDLSGKILIPFCTHGGSGLCGIDEKLAKECPDSMVADGLAILGEDAQNNQEDVRSEMRHWLSELGY